MNYKKVEKKVIYFEERILSNFEEHFSDLILDDFYGGGHKERISDSWFYDEYFEQYEQDIVDLLLKLENEGDEFYELQLRLIKLKRIIDTQLVKIEKSNNTETQKASRNSLFLLNNELNRDVFIEFLFYQLNDNVLIQTELAYFKSHFQESWENKIQWLGTELQITMLISGLIESKLLDPETQNFKHKLIRNHFINKKNSAFNERQLSSVYSEKKEMIPKDDVILKILEKVSTQFKLT